MTTSTPVASLTVRSRVGDRPMSSRVRSTSVRPPAARNRPTSSIATERSSRIRLSRTANGLARTVASVDASTRLAAGARPSSSVGGSNQHSMLMKICSCGLVGPSALAATGPVTVQTIPGMSLTEMRLGVFTRSPRRRQVLPGATLRGWTQGFGPGARRRPASPGSRNGAAGGGRSKALPSVSPVGWT